MRIKLQDLTDAHAVERALQEFDALERHAFLRKYGFRQARSYFLQWSGRLYDSKAIAGAAVGYQYPQVGPLKWDDFSGGERTANLDEQFERACSPSNSYAELLSCDALIGIVTSPNPNVLFEAGCAMGARVAILVAAYNSEALPKGLVDVPYVQLSGELARDVQAIARSALRLKIQSRVRQRSFSSAEAQLREAILDPVLLDSISSSSFERLVIDLLKDHGVEVSCTELKDEPFDFIFRSPLDGCSVLVQAKKQNRQSRVSLETVSAFLAALSGKRNVRGMIVSTAGFTKAATALAASASVGLYTVEDVLTANFLRDVR